MHKEETKENKQKKKNKRRKSKHQLSTKSFPNKYSMDILSAKIKQCSIWLAFPAA